MTVSRQREWQLKQKAKGKCTMCPKVASFKSYCTEHRLKKNRLELAKYYRKKND